MSTVVSVQLHNNLTPSEVSAYYAARVPHLPQRGHQWRCPCPIHHGKNDNFAVEAETGKWYCHSKCDRGGSVYDLEMEISNSDFRTAASEVRRIVGRPVLRQVEKEPELKWGLLGWSHTYLRERIEKVERENPRRAAWGSCRSVRAKIQLCRLDPSGNRRVAENSFRVVRWSGRESLLLRQPGPSHS